MIGRLEQFISWLGQVWRGHEALLLEQRILFLERQLNDRDDQIRDLQKERRELQDRLLVKAGTQPIYQERSPARAAINTPPPHVQARQAAQERLNKYSDYWKAKAAQAALAQSGLEDETTN